MHLPKGMAKPTYNLNPFESSRAHEEFRIWNAELRIGLSPFLILNSKFLLTAAKSLSVQAVMATVAPQANCLQILQGL